MGKGEHVFRVRVRFTTEGGRNEARENPRRYGIVGSVQASPYPAISVIHASSMLPHVAPVAFSSNYNTCIFNNFDFNNLSFDLTIPLLRTRPCSVPLSLDQGCSISALHHPHATSCPPFAPSRPFHLTPISMVKWAYSRGCWCQATRHSRPSTPWCTTVPTILHRTACTPSLHA